MSPMAATVSLRRPVETRECQNADGSAKTLYRTKAAAKRRIRLGGPERADLVVYACPGGGGYHIGHPPARTSE